MLGRITVGLFFVLLLWGNLVAGRRGGARLAAEIVRGGAVVLLELPVQLTTVHFTTGLFVFLLVYYMTAFDGVALPPSFSLKGYPGLFFGMGALVFLLAAMGAYVRHAGAGLSLPDWPTSLGGAVPAALAD